MRVKIKSFEERMRELARRERIQGVVDVFQWDPKAYSKPEEVPESHKVYLVKRARNTIVRNFAVFIHNNIRYAVVDNPVDFDGVSFTPDYPYHTALINFDPAYPWEGVLLGTDTTTQTEYTTYRLAQEITKWADTRTSSIFDNGVVWTSTWNAGRITEQIGEIGLVAFGYDGTNTHSVLLGRVASADGAFEPFTPDPSLNLTVNYRIMW